MAVATLTGVKPLTWLSRPLFAADAAVPLSELIPVLQERSMVEFLDGES